MFRLYTPIFFLQVFCLYHIYTNSKDFKWYMLVIFLPLIGSFIYLYIHFFNQRNIDKVGDTVQNIFSTDSKIDKLHKQVEFSGTVNNRIQLADEYLRKGHFEQAAKEYEECLIGAHHDDPIILMKLMQAEFQLKNFGAVIDIGEKLQSDPSFIKSNDRVALALSYHYEDKPDLAIAEFQAMNAKYSNYFQRYKFAELLQILGKENQSIDLLSELENEISQMDRLELRANKEEIRLIKKTLNNGGF